MNGPGTIAAVDLGYPARNSPPAMAIQGVSGTDQGSVAPAGGDPQRNANGPAFSWLAFVVLLVGLHLVYRYAGR